MVLTNVLMIRMEKGPKHLETMKIISMTKEHYSLFIIQPINTLQPTVLQSERTHSLQQRAPGWGGGPSLGNMSGLFCTEVCFKLLFFTTLMLIKPLEFVFAFFT